MKLTLTLTAGELRALALKKLEANSIPVDRVDAGTISLWGDGEFWSGSSMPDNDDLVKIEFAVKNVASHPKTPKKPLYCGFR